MVRDMRIVFKEARADPALGIIALIPSEYSKLEQLLGEMPDNAVVSEWKHDMGYVRYEYHMHTGSNVAELKQLYGNNVRSKNPQLVCLYSKQELQELIQDDVKV